MLIIIYMIATRITRVFSRVGIGIHYTFSELLNKEGAERREKMKSMRERAVWSCQFIDTIGGALPDNNKSIEEDSLRDQILKHTIPNFTFSEDSRNYVLDMFNKGIILNPIIYNKTLNPQAKQKELIGRRPTQKLIGKHFSFCPNMLVTRQIFWQLFYQNQHFMTYGQSGIGKTMAHVQFNILSSIANKYRYHAYADPQEQSYLKDLKQKGLIFDVPKVFYWNMAYESSVKTLPTETTVKKILLLQATELSNDQRAKLQLINSLQQFGIQLKKMYGARNIITKVVIDQLNFTASLMRKWNLFYKNYKKKQDQYQKLLRFLEIQIQTEKDQTTKRQLKKKEQKTYLQYRQWKQKDKGQRNTNETQFQQPAKTLKALMNKTVRISSVTIFNSSVDIELDLLNDSIGPGIQTLGINGHNELLKKKIEFSQYLREPWGQNDFYHYFWFQIQKRLFAKGFDHSQLQNLKQFFYDEVKEKKVPRYHRFLYIRELFKKQPSLFNFTNKLTDEQIGYKIEQIIYSLKVYSLQCCRKKVDDFLSAISKGSVQTKKKFTILLHENAVYRINRGQGSKNMRINLNEIDVRCLGEGPYKTRRYLASNAYYNECVQPIILIDYETVTFPWTAHDYLEISEIHSIKQEFPKLTTLQTIQLYINWRDEIGKQLKNSLVQVLRLPKTVVKFIYQMSNYQTIEKRFIINCQQTFFSFQKNMLKLYIHFIELIKLATQRPNEDFFGLPFYYNNKKQIRQLDQNNPTTDFVIVSCKEQKQKSLRIFIDSFQITVTLEQKTILYKITKAKNIFIPMIQNDTVEWKSTVTHTIVCRRQLAKNRAPIIVQVKDGQNLIINFMAIEDIQIEYCTDPIALQTFQKAKTTNLDLSKKKTHPYKIDYDHQQTRFHISNTI